MSRSPGGFLRLLDMFEITPQHSSGKVTTEMELNNYYYHHYHYKWNLDEMVGDGNGMINQKRMCACPCTCACAIDRNGEERGCGREGGEYGNVEGHVANPHISKFLQLRRCALLLHA